MIFTIPASGGFVSDVEPHDLADGQWSYVQNARFRDGYAGKIGGHAALPVTAPASTPLHVAFHQVEDKRYWIWSDADNTYADDGTTQTNITGTTLTGGATDRFTSCVIGGVYVQNNQIDVPSYWDGDTTSNLTALPDWDANDRCKSIRSFKNYLIALNITKSTTEYPHMVKWSHAAVPGSIPASWDATDATKDAGERDLSETTDHIVDGLALGDSFIVYKERSAYGLQYIGGNAIFRSYRLPGNYGALAQNCVAQTPLGHVVLANGPDVVLHNGGEPQSILSGRVRDWLIGSFNGASTAGAFVVANMSKDEAWICIPTNGGNAANTALIWNWKNNTFTVRDLPAATAAAWGVANATLPDTWATTSGGWESDTDRWDANVLSLAEEKLVIAATNPNALYLMDQTTRFDGSDFQVTLERTGMAFGKQQSVKTLRGCFPRIDGTTGTELKFEYGAAMDVEGPYVWSDPITYTVGSTYRADGFASGRFLALRVRSNANGAWRLKSIDLDIVERGSY